MVHVFIRKRVCVREAVFSLDASCVASLNWSTSGVAESAQCPLTRDATCDTSGVNSA